MMSVAQFRLGILAAAAMLTTTVGVSVVPVSTAAEPLEFAMHDMMSAQMQSPAPSMQQGEMGGMQGGEHGGISGSMQQHGPAAQTPAPGMHQGQVGPMEGHGGMSMQQSPMSGGMSASDEHARMMEMMRQRGMQPGMSMGPARVDLTDRIEGRIAFLHAELYITDAQMPAWNKFADALRSARKHLLEARQTLTQTTPSARLEQYQRHLSERLQAVTDARAAFDQLYAALDQSQKRTAEELVIPYIATF